MAVLAAAALLASAPVRVHAQAVFSEQAVKAAYLYRFAGYVEWPAERFEAVDSPLAIGVLGAAGLADELVRITAGRTVGGRPIEVRRVTGNESLQGLHILYVDDEVAERLGAAAAAARVASVLTVTDIEDSSAGAGIINFRVAGQRVRFEVFIDEARRSGLKLSAGLLAVAERVHTGTP